MSRDFDFRNHNTVQSFKILSPEDKITFKCGEPLEFGSYMFKCHHGARQFLLHQDPKSIPRSLIKYRILQVLHYSVVVAMSYYILMRVWLFSSGV